MTSSYENVNLRNQKRAEDIEFPPLDEVPLIEKISQPGYKAPATTKGNNALPQQEQAFSVPSHVPEEVRAEYNKKAALYDQQEQQSQQEPEVEQQEENIEQQESQEVEEVEVSESQVSDNYNKKRNQESAKESWNALRLKAEEAHREKERLAKELRDKDAMFTRMLEMQMQQMNKPQQQQATEPDLNSILNSIDSDGLASGDQLKKTAQENKRYVDKVALEIAETRRQMQELITENRVRAKYPDLERVLTHENQLILEQRAPGNFARLKSMPDSWDKVELLYEAIKSYGIDRVIEYKQDQSKIKSNMQKPRAINSVVSKNKESALANVNSFVDEYSMTEEDRRRELREAMHFASQR
jgi:hypothetical protein